MAAGIPARLTAAQGRRFGCTVGAAFLVFAALAWWREHPTPTIVFAALGSSLTLSGLLVPTYLGPIERAWMKLAHLISRVTTPIVMGVMYLVVLTPTGMLRRALGGNPLAHRPVSSSYWQARPAGKRAGDLTRQY